MKRVQRPALPSRVAQYLDRREALAERYQKTFRRLCQQVATALQAPDLDSTNFIDELLEADDHGLLPWCINGSGQFRAPFDPLRVTYPDIWGVLRQRLF